MINLSLDNVLLSIGRCYLKVSKIYNLIYQQFKRVEKATEFTYILKDHQNTQLGCVFCASYEISMTKFEDENYIYWVSNSNFMSVSKYSVWGDAEKFSGHPNSFPNITKYLNQNMFLKRLFGQAKDFATSSYILDTITPKLPRNKYLVRNCYQTPT